MKLPSRRPKAPSVKAEGSSPVFVDLSDVEMHKETQTVRVRVIEVHAKGDVQKAKENASKGYLLIFDMSCFEGTAEEMKETARIIRSSASETGTAYYRINDNMSILAQPGTKVEKIRIVRKEENGG